MYKSISFTEFKNNFINQPDGFMPVYAYFHENNDGVLEKTVKIDMICEWRITDGKFNFLSVSFNNENELNEIKEYLKVCANILSKKIIKNAESLKFEDVGQ